MWGGGAPPPPQVKPGGIPGCLKVLIILGVLAIVAVIAFVFFLSSLVNNLVPGGFNGAGNGGTGSDCPFLSDAEAREVVGGNADAILLAGIYDASIGIIIDKRVLPAAEDCWITDGEKTYIVRIAKSEGNGPTVFAQEKANAQPTSEDQGGGVTLENPGYFAGDVTDLGDEAFCTGLSSAIMAGVLARQGDTVVYASVGPPSETGAVPNMGDLNGVTTAPDLCTLAQEVAKKVLQ
jgi:hypothetical protein